MKAFRELFFVILTSLLITAGLLANDYADSASTFGVVADMEWIESTSVDSLLAENLAKAPVFLAIQSKEDIQIPGLSREACQIIVNNNSYKILEGMSDVVYSRKHASLRVKTRDFAKDYNLRLYQSLEPNLSVGR